MRIRALGAAAVLVALAATALPAAASTWSPPTPPPAETPDAEAILQQVQDVRAGRADGDLTLLLRDLWLVRDQLEGASFAQATDEFGRPILPDVVESANFRIHYDDDPASPNHATPEWAAQTAEVFEEVYADEVTRQGWRRPGSDGTRGGDGRIDVYLTELGEQGIFGFASIDEDATCDVERCIDVHGWMGMDNDYSTDEYGVPPIEALQATTAHEFHHLIQYAESFLTDRWFFEATATWMESVVYPDADARTFYIPAWAETTPVPITVTDGQREYALYVFLRYLADRFGDTIVRDAWRAALDAGAHSLDGLDTALAVHGSSLEEAYGGFAAASAFWNAGGFPRDVVGGATVTYPAVARVTDAPLADGDSGTIPLSHTSAALADVTVAGDRIGARVTVTDPATRGAVALVAAGPAGVRTALATLQGGTATVSLDGLAGDEVTVVLANGDPTLIAPRTDPFGEFEYRQEDIGFTVEIGSDIVGEPGPGPVDPGEPQDALIDGGRVGAPDAVAQAIATSQATFPDGSAQRVVLATSANFPDALAGAGLARDLGPILFTPFAETLDPRVAAEIERVAGPGAPVLTLGGTAAVTESAATSARAITGVTTCSAPIPSSCRFAGTGREATAALIGSTVQAEIGGTTALIARGDDFADALTGGAFAAASGAPLLLTPSDQANLDTSSFLEAHPELTDVIVLGGVAAVDDATAGALGATGRVAGAERTETSAAIAAQLWAGAGLGRGGAVLVNVRAADAWPAALSAAVASAVFDAPQLGVETGQPLTAPVAAHLRDVVDGPVQAFGSAALVTDAQLAAAVAARG